MGDADDVLHRRHRAQHVGHVGDGDDLGARRQQLLEILEVEVAVVVDRRPFEHGALALAVEVPGTMLEWCSMIESTISSPSPIAMRAEAVGDEIDGLGRRAREDDLVGDAAFRNRAHVFARALIGLGRGVRHEVQAAVHVGVAGLHGAHHGVDDRARLLRRGGIVEIDERLAIDLAGEDRKVAPDRLDIVGRTCACTFIRPILFVIRGAPKARARNPRASSYAYDPVMAFRALRFACAPE